MPLPNRHGGSKPVFAVSLPTSLVKEGAGPDLETCLVGGALHPFVHYGFPILLYFPNLHHHQNHLMGENVT